MKNSGAGRSLSFNLRYIGQDMQDQDIRTDWTREEIQSIYHQPLLELVYQAASLHRRHHNPREVQICHLISVKTGGCPEDCKYCAQSSRYTTFIQAQPLLKEEEVLDRAKKAAAKGTSRICLGAAWRDVRPSKQFDSILSMVEAIKKMGLEVCCTLGMMREPEAQRLAHAGAYAYNHNLDTSASYYKKVATTRTYEDRLQTLSVVEKTNMTVCCGGIIGMGESEEDRLQLLHTLATRSKHPESVPINLLTRIPGTPMEDQAPVPFWEYLRLIATARIIMPKSMVRLSSGRITLQKTEQALCFLAGANSIFSGEKLLTVDNPDFDVDNQMLELFGLQKQKPFHKPRIKIF